MQFTKAGSLITFFLFILYGFGVYGMIIMFNKLPNSDDGGARVEETMRAPFAPGGTAATPLTSQQKKALETPENVIAVNKPHRSSKYILDWAAEATATALTFDGNDMNAHVQMIGQNFASAGLQDFQTYLDSTGLVAHLQKNALKMESFIQATPILQNEGDFGGVYRWLIDIPVTVSQMSTAMRGYGSKDTTESQTITVRLQIGRTQDPRFSQGMAIERWTVLGAS